MKIILFTIIVFTHVSLRAQIMEITDETAGVTFVTKHIVGNLEGTFKGVAGTVMLDTNNLGSSFLKLAFATSTVLHNDQLTGPNLIKANCFNPSQFPQIELSSSAITRLPNKNQYHFTGDLKVKGVTKTISFPVTFTPNIGGYDFSFTFPMVKKQFDLHCSIRKQFKITVKGYAKRIVVEEP